IYRILDALNASPSCVAGPAWVARASSFVQESERSDVLDGLPNYENGVVNSFMEPETRVLTISSSALPMLHMKLDKSVELRKLEVKRLHILRQIRDCRQQSAVAEAPGVQESDGNTNIDAQSTESTPKPTRSSIVELHNQYNEFINQRAILQRECGRRYSDPLEVLPTEIWIECLNLVLADEIAVNGSSGGGNGYYNASQGVYHLLLVSKSWWTKLLNVPSLWSTILVDGDPDVLYRLTAGLYFSGSLPLTIIIELPFVETPSMTEVTDVTSTEAYKILTEPQVKSRIKRIIFQQSLQSRRAHRDGNDAPFITFYDTAFSLLRPFQHLPELEAVQMRHSFDYYSRTLLEEGFPISPKLRGVYRWCLPAITLEGIMRNLSRWSIKEYGGNADDEHTMQELRD
ncbi:9704_t:CDS:2, partial [Acaulospora colombiana]